MSIARINKRDPKSNLPGVFMLQVSFFVLFLCSPHFTLNGAALLPSTLILEQPKR